jgi:hypothetical protein
MLADPSAWRINGGLSPLFLPAPASCADAALHDDPRASALIHSLNFPETAGPTPPAGATPAPELCKVLRRGMTPSRKRSPRAQRRGSVAPRQQVYPQASTARGAMFLLAGLLPVYTSPCRKHPAWLRFVRARLKVTPTPPQGDAPMAKFQVPSSKFQVPTPVPPTAT